MSKSRILGWSLLAFIIYCTLGAVVYFASLLALQKGVLIDMPWFAATQKSLYRKGIGYSRKNWIAQPECIAPDPDLIYVPAIGSCRFEDIEFKTTLNFDETGRHTGPRPAGAGIAVIGDSHAMGWGVNDEETFAAHLQTLSKRPVFNLGVASYGTARELLRLEKSGLLNRVDTIILQYCNNDLGENLKFDTASKQELRDRIFGRNAAPATQQQTGRLAFIAKGYGLALAAPFRALSERLRRKDFTRHYEALIGILARHGDKLNGKRVIVFYSNTYGQKFRNYPEGQDARLPNVYFVDPGMSRSDYHELDDHLTPEGHRKVAEYLYSHLHAPDAD
ncbi:MAG: SGNH/GDSL hydrolase family protein [Pseudomonadota bacterium]